MDPSGWEIAGTVADIVAGVGTAGALFWAVFVYRRQVSDAHIEQASKVFVTFIKANDGGREATGIGSIIAMSGHRRGLVIDNSSDLPIFDVFAVVIADDRPLKPLKVYRIPRLIGRDTQSFPDAANILEGRSVSAQIMFRDAADRQWYRDGEGRLHAYSDKPSLLRRLRSMPRLQVLKDLARLD